MHYAVSVTSKQMYCMLCQISTWMLGPSLETKFVLVSFNLKVVAVLEVVSNMKWTLFFLTPFPRSETTSSKLSRKETINYWNLIFYPSQSFLFKKNSMLFLWIIYSWLWPLSTPVCHKFISNLHNLWHEVQMAYC